MCEIWALVEYSVTSDYVCVFLSNYTFLHQGAKVGKMDNRLHNIFYNSVFFLKSLISLKVDHVYVIVVCLSSMSVAVDGTAMY